MKKIILVLASLSLSAVIFSPLLATAGKAPDCCKLSRPIELDGVTYNEGIFVGEINCDGEITDPCPTADDDPPTATADCAVKTWGLLCLLNATYNITDWIFTFAMAFVGMMVILGAFTLVTAAGSPEKLKKGKDYILYAAVGMLAALLSKAVPSIVKSFLG